MAHGAPDWYIYRTAASTFPLGDMAELATRLGALSTFDRRGDTILQEDFEHGLARWGTDTSGTGAAVAIDTTYFRSGPNSIKLTQGSADNAYAAIHTAIYYPRVSFIAAEFSIMIPISFGELRLDLYLYSGAVLTQFSMRYNRATTLIEIVQLTGSWPDISATVQTAAAAWIWHTIKLVGDLNAQKYVRLIFDQIEYDLSAYDAVVATDTSTAPHFLVSIGIRNTDGASRDVYIDDVILTQDEP